MNAALDQPPNKLRKGKKPNIWAIGLNPDNKNIIILLNWRVHTNHIYHLGKKPDHCVDEAWEIYLKEKEIFDQMPF